MQLLRIDACAGADAAVERTRRALDALGLDRVPIETVLLRTPTEIADLPFGGSPTLLVDGEDPFPSPAPVRALACRLYVGASGVEGAPSEEAIAAALRSRLAG